MNFDINLLLIPLLLISSSILLVNFLLNGRSGGNRSGKSPSEPKIAKHRIKEPWWLDYSRSLFPVIFLVVLIRSFIIEPYQIPSSSMVPTLERGDFILVSKFSYGLRLPLSNYEFVGFRRPDYGDVIVFNFPMDPRIRYIKRVVGKSGDLISYTNKTLSINGRPVSEQLIDNRLDYQDFEETLGERTHRLREYKFLDNHELHDDSWIVPDKHYFVMGDNRDNSNDSRYWGFVPHDQLVGQAFFIWLHWESWGKWPSLKRSGSII